MNWISVKDRLPDNHQEVMICTESGIRVEIFYSDAEQFLDSHCYETLLKYVTHWMPLPDKPAEEG